MALLKFGAIVTEGSGSLGGHTIQHSRGGMQLRNKPIPRSGPSAAQYAIRSINPVLQAGWKALTDAQRTIWNDWPVIHGIMNAKGDHRPLSGHSLWMKYQYLPLSLGYSFYSHPSLYVPGYFGPELIRNGTFYDGSYWAFSSGSIVNQRLYMPPAAWNCCRQPNVNIILNSFYRIEFDFENVGADANLMFRNGSNVSMFDIFRYEGITYPSAHYKVTAKCLLASTWFQFVQEVPRNGWYIDNFSLKKFP